MPETVTETTAPPATEAPVTEPPKSEDVSALPEWAQKKITDLNNESANYRVRARDHGRRALDRTHRSLDL